MPLLVVRAEGHLGFVMKVDNIVCSMFTAEEMELLNQCPAFKEAVDNYDGTASDRRYGGADFSRGRGGAS